MLYLYLLLTRKI